MFGMEASSTYHTLYFKEILIAPKIPKIAVYRSELLVLIVGFLNLHLGLQLYKV